MNSDLKNSVKNEVAAAFAVLLVIIIGAVVSVSVSVAVSKSGSVPVNENISAEGEEYSEEADDDSAEFDGSLDDINDLVVDRHKLVRRENLNDEGKRIYDELYEAVSTHSSFVYYDNNSYSDERNDILGDIFNDILSYYVLTDHPELFWTQGGFEISAVNTASGAEYTYNVTYDCDKNKIPQYEKEIQAKAEEIISSVPNANNYEKALWVHDWIVDNTTYDNDVSWIIGEDKSFGASIYSLLVKGRSNCNGYSKTYKYLMDMLGIPCTVIAGTCTDGVLHGWNVIEFDGECYQIDATWDDPIGVRQAVHHNYFCITDEEMYKSRTVMDCISTPICTASKYNYYVYYGIFASEINSEVLDKAVKLYKEKENDYIELKLASSQMMDEAVKYITENEEFDVVLRDNGFKGSTSINYSKYDDTFVVEVSLN